MIEIRKFDAGYMGADRRHQRQTVVSVGLPRSDEPVNAAGDHPSD
jgi:hypothetical protein